MNDGSIFFQKPLFGLGTLSALQVPLVSCYRIGEIAIFGA